MTQEVISLTEELRATRADLTKVLHRLDWLDQQQRAERKKSRWHRLGSVLVALTMAGVIALFVREAQERDRAEYRSCLTANGARADIRASIVESVLTLGANSPDPERVAEMADRLADRLVVTLPDRQC